MHGNFGIKGFVPVSLVDWPGNICSVMFLGGCNFRCPACHNHRLVLERESLPDVPIEEPLAYLRAHARWIDGVTITGGEPTLHKSLFHVLRALRNVGVATKLDTNGSRPEVIERLLAMGLVDAVFMDVKAPLVRSLYSAVAGVPVDTARIEASIDLLLSSAVEVTFRTTVIPGLVEESELEQITRRLGTSRRFLVQPFRCTDTLDPSMASRGAFDQGRIEAMKRHFEVNPAAYPVAV